MDPLFYGSINLDPAEKAQLHSGDKVISRLNIIWQLKLYSIISVKDQFVEMIINIFL